MSEKTQTERELLMERADLMGLEYKRNIPTDKLRKLVDGELTPNENNTVKAEKTKVDVNQVRVDFRKEQTALTRIILTCNDPQMKDWETTPYLHVSNSILSLPRITVPFGVEWHVPKIYLDMLKNQNCTITVKAKNEQGRPITVPKEIKKYNIQELPPLTPDELAELKQSQLMRDGVAKA
jgi:hypothetical protein